MSVTRIKNNQITDSTITAQKIAAYTLTGGLFANTITLNSNVTVTGNFSVLGNTESISATNTYVNDPLVVFNNGFTGTPSYDVGILVNRNLTATGAYGSVNSAWVWREQDKSFAGLMTTETGGATGPINNSGYANLTIGNITANSITLTSGAIIDSGVGIVNTPISGSTGYFTTLNGTAFSTGNAVITGGYITGVSNITATTGNVSAWYVNTLNSTFANITSATFTSGFATANAVITGGYADNYPIGANVAATGRFTTLTTTGISTLNGNLIAASGTNSSSTTTGAAVVVGGVGVSGNINVGGNITATAVGTTVTLANIVTTNGLFWSNGVSALGTPYGNVQMLANLASYTVPQANVAIYAGVSAYTTNQAFYPMFSNLSTAGNTVHSVASGIQYNPSSGNLSLTAGNLVIAASGNAFISNVTIGGTDGNSIVSNTGKIGLGSIANITVTGGVNGYAVTTNGSGSLNFNAANAIVLGANVTGQLVSNAITLTSTTGVTDAIAQMNQILGKLTPPSPINFPGNVASALSAASSFTITTAQVSGLMTGDAARGTGWTQQNQISGNTYQLSGGSTFNAIRANNVATSTLAAIKSGSGNVRVWIGGNTVTGYQVLTGSLGTVTNGNLTITNDTDYHNIIASVASGFWYSANVSASSTGGILPGWNTITIEDFGGYTTGNTNALLWYNDISSVPAGTPTYSNCSITLTTNTVVYSSTIPHLTSGATTRLKGNLANLSGDTYSGNTNVTSSTAAGGAFTAPTAVTWTNTVGPAGYAGTVPLPRYFCNATYGSGGTLYYETPSTILTTGFGSSTSGPTLTVTNNYASAATSATQVAPTGFAPGVTVLYKTGTTTQIEETSIPVNAVGVGSGNGYRIANPGSTNTPVYTGTEAVFNSASSALQTSDCINIGSGTQGILTWSQTNFSTGYWPVGPNLTGQAATQYFTMRFVRTGVSKFDIKYTGTISGLWVALPGASPNGTDNYASPTNGWLDVSTAYAGAGIPGTGSGGNGSSGCAVGGTAVLNSAQTNKSVTATFGTLSSSNTANNYIYVRVALTSGQSLTALTMETATH
jgi:hypothetical protein